MCRRKQDLVGAGTEEGAGRLAVARRDALGVAGRQVERVDLIERVARLALALKDQPPAVRRPVALACAATFDRQPADARQEITLFVLGRAGLRNGPYTGGALGEDSHNPAKDENGNQSFPAHPDTGGRALWARLADPEGPRRTGKGLRRT